MLKRLAFLMLVPLGCQAIAPLRLTAGVRITHGPSSLNGATYSGGTANGVLSLDASSNVVTSSAFLFSTTTGGGYQTTITGTGTGTGNVFTLNHNGTGTTQYPRMYFERARTASTAVASGDFLGDIQFYGYASAAYRLAGYLSFKVPAAPSGANVPGQLTAMLAGANGTQTNSLVMTSSLVTIGAPIVHSSASVVDAYSDTSGTITAGSTATLTYTEVVDRLGEFVTSSFTAITAGYYEVIAHAGISQTAGSACLIVKQNGSAFAGSTVCNQGVTALASVLDVSFTRILNLAANDIVRVDASATTANAVFQKLTFTIKQVP